MTDTVMRFVITSDATGAKVALRETAEGHVALTREQMKGVQAATAFGKAMDGAASKGQQNRAAFQQLGFQFNDIAVQMASGTNAGVIFAQQSGQVIQALQMMSVGAGNSTSMFGKFAAFMGGPWGIAISLAISGISLLTSRLGENKDAAVAAKLGADGLSEAQGVLGKMFDLTSGKLKDQNELLRMNALLTASKLRAEGLAEKAAADQMLAPANRRHWSTFFMSLGGAGNFAPGMDNSREMSDRVNRLAADVRSGKISPENAMRQADRIDFSGLNITKVEFQSMLVQAVSGPLKMQTADMIDRSLRDNRLDPGLREDRRPRTRTRTRRARDYRSPASVDGAMGERLLSTAQGYSGLNENRRGDNLELQGLFGQAGLRLDPDKTAWCAAFVDAVLSGNGIKGTGKLNARSYMDWGQAVQGAPQRGDVVVLSRGKDQTKGHVGFFAGYDQNGNILLTGGNQSDEVTTQAFDRKRVLAIRRAPSADEQAKAAEAAARKAELAAEQMQRALDNAAGAVDRINDQWGDQPKLIVQAENATADLDKVIADLEERKKAMSEEDKKRADAIIAQAKAAKAVVQDGLGRPMRELTEQHDMQMQLMSLTLQGRHEEAELLQRTASIVERTGQLTEVQRQTVLQQIQDEEALNEKLRQREDVLSMYRAAASELRGMLEDVLSGGSASDMLQNMQRSFRQLQGRVLTDAIFGPALRELEKYGDSPKAKLEQSVDHLSAQNRIAAMSIADLAAAASAATRLILHPQTGGRTGFSALLPTGLNPLQLQAALMAPAAEGEIVIKGRPNSMADISPDDFLGKAVKTLIDPALQQLDKLLGTKLADRLGGVVAGGVKGYVEAGPVGAVLGALKGQYADSKMLGRAYDGARRGSQIALAGNVLGLGMSANGSALGGALGGLTGIPFADIGGSIIGGFVGKLFEKKKWGSATITSLDAVTTAGNNGARKDAATGAAGQVQDALRAIADQLGAGVGSFNVSIGQYKDKGWRVDTTGSGRVKGGVSTVQAFGDDAASAINAALVNAIADGALTGISPAIQKALKSSDDIDKAMKEALRVREVEDILGGIGGALQRQFSAFEGQAKERLTIAQKYGFDVVAIEKRNAEDRAKLVDEILTSRVGRVQDLLKDMTSGNLFEGTAAERRSALMADFAKAKADADAGVDGAASRFADVARQLVETSRSAFGTAGAEYAADRAATMSAAEKIIAAENARVRAAQDAAIATAKGIETNNALTNESNDLLAQLVTATQQNTVSTSAGVPFALNFMTARQVSL